VSCRGGAATGLRPLLELGLGRHCRFPGHPGEGNIPSTKESALSPGPIRHLGEAEADHHLGEAEAEHHHLGVGHHGQ